MMGRKWKYFQDVSGNTLNSHKGFIKRLKERKSGLKEVSEVEECDFILFFCPIVFRAATDIEAALQKLQSLSETKPAVVVVLHHTIKPDISLPQSGKSVNRNNTLTVDCVFREDRGFLDCDSNHTALENCRLWIKQNVPKSSSLTARTPNKNPGLNLPKEKKQEAVKMSHSVERSFVFELKPVQSEDPEEGTRAGGETALSGEEEKCTGESTSSQQETGEPEEVQGLTEREPLSESGSRKDQIKIILKEINQELCVSQSTLQATGKLKKKVNEVKREGQKLEEGKMKGQEVEESNMELVRDVEMSLDTVTLEERQGYDTIHTLSAGVFLRVGW